MTFPIKQALIHDINFPKEPYRHGYGKPEGVVFHCTDSPGRPDTAVNEAAFEARTWSNAFVHFFVDDKEIIQVADTDNLAWGCGSVGNPRFVQIELCMIDDPEQFKEAYARYVWLGASMLHKNGLDASPAPNGTIWAHADVSKYLGDTDHTDPIAYLQSHGITWDKHIENVQRELAALKAPTPQIEVLVQGKQFKAIIVDGTTYVLWAALVALKTPHDYKGDGVMMVDGSKIQGVVYDGDTYLPWHSLAPGIKAEKVNGIWHFTH